MSDRHSLPPGLPTDGKLHNLTFGDTFSAGSNNAFHTIRYDFKPASVDTTKEATVDIGGSNSVTVQVPHVEGSGTSHTVYKGNKRPTQKECVLIVNPQTGELTLERISTTLQLKKTRKEGSSRVQQSMGSRPSTPLEPMKSSPAQGKTSPKRKIPPSAPPPQITHHHHQPPPPAQKHRYAPPQPAQNVDLMSSSDSSSSSGSSSESEPEADQNTRPAVPSHTHHQSRHRLPSNVYDDLQLSESDSDSD